MNEKPKPSIERIAAAMNRHLVPAVQNQKRSDFPSLNKGSDKTA